MISKEARLAPPVVTPRSRLEICDIELRIPGAEVGKCGKKE
jgi:hypothetical protein